MSLVEFKTSGEKRLFSTNLVSNYFPDVNEIDKQAEEEINKKSQLLGLETNSKNLTLTTTTTTKSPGSPKLKISSKRNEIQPTRRHNLRKSDSSKGEHRAQAFKIDCLIRESEIQF